MFKSIDRCSGSVVESPSHTGDWGSIPSCDRPKSLIQVMTGPLPSTRQQVQVSRVLGDDHDKHMPSDTVGVT